MSIEANVYVEGSSSPTLFRIHFDKSEIEGMSEEERKEHLQEMVKEQVFQQIRIEWSLEKDAVALAT
jgi:hypothetical protein